MSSKGPQGTPTLPLLHFMASKPWDQRQEPLDKGRSGPLLGRPSTRSTSQDVTVTVLVCRQWGPAKACHIPMESMIQENVVGFVVRQEFKSKVTSVTLSKSLDLSEPVW